MDAQHTIRAEAKLLIKTEDGQAEALVLRQIDVEVDARNMDEALRLDRIRREIRRINAAG